MPKYPFLSDDWVAEARRIYAQAQEDGELAPGTGTPAAPVAPVRVNLVVTQAPFSDAPLDAHVDTSAGQVAVDTGHLAAPDVTVSLDYATARSLFVSGDVQAVMQAFLSGKIKVDGDLSKLLDPRSGVWPAASPGWLAPAPPGPTGGPTSPGTLPLAWLGPSLPGALNLASRLQEITE
jgi:hypothetical protein